MLQIISNGTALDLPTDISINLTIENPFMVEDRIPTPHSLTFELPPTANNLQLFGFPNRIATYGVGSFERSIPCVIRFSGLQLAVGRLVLISFDEVLKLNFTSMPIGVSSQKKLFEVDTETVVFEGTSSTTNWDSPGNYAYNYYSWVKNNYYGNNEKYMMAPIARLNTSFIPFNIFFRTSTGSPGGRFMGHIFHRMFYNHMNADTREFYLGTVNKTHSYIFPQLRLSYLLDSVLPELEANPFRDTASDLYKLFIPTYTHPNWKQMPDVPISSGVIHPPTKPILSNEESAGSIVGQPFVRISDYLPDITVGDFLLNIGKVFCLTVYRNINGKFRIMQNSDILNRTVVRDWTHKVLNDYKTETSAAKKYKYGYKQDKKTYRTEETYTTLPTVFSMEEQSITFEDDHYSELFYIEENNSFYRKSAYREHFESIYPLLYEDVISYEYLGRNEETELEDTSSSVYDSTADFITKPITNLYPWFNTAQGDREQVSISIRQAEFTIHEALSTTIDDQIIHQEREKGMELLYHAGWKDVYSGIIKSTPSPSDYVVPYLSPYGSEDLSLDWDGPNGLLEKFHNPFKAWIEKPKLKLSAQMLLNALDYHQLDITEKIHIDGRNYFIEKIQFTIRPNKIEPAQIDFIEA